jgi:ABC-type proline/glycine betaine transport system permease subunit
MAPAVRVSALGIRFTKEELIELKRVWNDKAWDEEEHDLANGEEIN